MKVTFDSNLPAILVRAWWRWSLVTVAIIAVVEATLQQFCSAGLRILAREALGG